MGEGALKTSRKPVLTSPPRSGASLMTQLAWLHNLGQLKAAVWSTLPLVVRPGGIVPEHQVGQTQRSRAAPSFGNCCLNYKLARSF